MPFDLEELTEPVTSVLAGYPRIELPLLRSELRKHPQLDRIARMPAAELFPGVREPMAAHSGLLLLLGGWEQSHETAQDIMRPEGSYWHAIAHRMEPDMSNAGYWFRRVGAHPIFKILQSEAEQLGAAYSSAGWTVPEPWDALAFLKVCAEAADKRASARHSLAVAIQALEWRLLFEWCAAKSSA